MDEGTISQDGAEGRVERPEEGWQRKARAFSRAKLGLYGVQTAASLLFLLALWITGLASWLEGVLGGAISQRWLPLLLLLLAYQILSALVFLPFAYYGGFILQHRFGLSTQRWTGWMSDWVKGTVLGAVFFLAGMEAFYLLIAAYPNGWWLILSLGLSLVAVLLTFVAPVVLLPLFYKCSPLENREMSDRIERLAERAGARVSRVCSIDMSRRTTAANAALAGLGRTRQVLLGDTLLQQFSPDEVETVVAHEFGHHVHGDIWKGLALEVAGIWVGLFLLQWPARPLILAYGFGDIASPAQLPLLLLMGELAGLLLMPAANAFSRRHEAEADRFAARMSDAPEAYASALYRLARQNLSELWPPRWVELLLYSHPAIGRRMATLEGTRRRGPAVGKRDGQDEQDGLAERGR